MKKSAVVDKTICVACGVCMQTCPRDAIVIYKGCYARVAEEKCVGCRLCAKACPAGCIAVTEEGAVK